MADELCHPRASNSKAGPCCKWLGIRCKDRAFQQWLGCDSEEVAVTIVRRLCGVASRKDIDGNAAAEKRFQHSIRFPWGAHVEGRDDQ